MKLCIKIALTTILMFLMWTPITVNADNLEESEIKKASIEDKMNLDLLYVFEGVKYNEIMGKEALIVNVKNNFMFVDTENLDEELNIINSAKSYFVLGPIENDVFPSSNLGGHLFYNEYDSFINKENVNLDSNLVITNEESIVDMLNAIQIGNVEDRTLLLIKDNRLTDEDIEFIKENGEDKNILFVEGELDIPKEVKYNILQLANNPKYEIDTFRISKIIEEKKVDLKSYLPKNINIPKSDIFNNIQEASKQIVDKNSKMVEEQVQNKNKMLSYQDELDIEEYIFDKVKSYRFINTLQKQENVSLNIETNKEIEDDVEYDLSLRLTYANPVSIHKYVSVEKDVFVTSKETSSEIIASVMEGDYGSEEERKENLEKEGYNYEEIQKEINSILEIRKRNRKSHVEVKQQSSTRLQNLFINEVLKMKGWTYSQERRWEQGYADCSSIIIRALINTGMINDHSNMTTRTIDNDNRFFEISMDSLEVGDILWYPGHVEIYMGGNTTFGAFRPGKVSGYASGVNRFSRAYRIAQP